MKKIDLHIHTKKSISDADFNFDINNLQRYVAEMQLDCIAITNHNLFDLDQFNEINSTLSIEVLPGIEIDLEGGHLLLISDSDELLDFTNKCKLVTDCIETKEDEITVDKLKEIFPRLDKYLLIPHHDKRPILLNEVIKRIGVPIYCGEVGSVRKFKKCLADRSSLVPVLFSDERISNEISTFSTRQTYIRLDEISIRGLKSCLSDKNKIFLTSMEDGNEFFQANDDGLLLSTGLNIILGERSSGKTFTLESVNKANKNVKYIKQFSLLQNDEEKFEKLLSIRQSNVSESYLNELKTVLLSISDIDLKQNNIDLEQYLSSLLKFATESEKADSFASAALFSETLYTEDNLENLKELINSAELLISNTEYKEIIDKHITKNNLISLAKELIEKYIDLYENNLKKRWVNELVTNIQEELRFRTTTSYVEEFDYYKYLLDSYKIDKFSEIVNHIKKERVVSSKQIRNFKIVAYSRRYTGALQLKNKSRRKISFTNSFNNYFNAYEFLESLREMELEETEYYKYFIDFEYKTLNEDGNIISGGERSEFNLLHEINDALKHDILLIDEPESSFDNIFLKSQVNALIKDISKEIPVIIVTHNNTVGASIKPDYIAYTKKEILDGAAVFKIFSGFPHSKKLMTKTGEESDNYGIMINCLEAGKDAYIDRRTNSYEILEN